MLHIHKDKCECGFTPVQWQCLSRRVLIVAECMEWWHEYTCHWYSYGVFVCWLSLNVSALLVYIVCQAHQSCFGWYDTLLTWYAIYTLEGLFALPFYFFRGHLVACTKFKFDRPNWNHKPCECWLFYLPFDFCLYGSHYSHTAWWKPICIENVVSARGLNQK